MASSPTAMSWPSSRSNNISERAVYVIEAGSRSLAFEAAGGAEAELFVRSHWFRRALDQFCLERPGMRISSDCPRAATEREAVAFRRIADEFADATGEFLVAHLD